MLPTKIYCSLHCCTSVLFLVVKQPSFELILSTYYSCWLQKHWALQVAKVYPIIRSRYCFCAKWLFEISTFLSKAFEGRNGKVHFSILTLVQTLFLVLQSFKAMCIVFRDCYNMASAILHLR